MEQRRKQKLSKTDLNHDRRIQAQVKGAKKPAQKVNQHNMAKTFTKKKRKLIEDPKPFVKPNHDEGKFIKFLYELSTLLHFYDTHKKYLISHIVSKRLTIEKVTLTPQKLQVPNEVTRSSYVHTTDKLHVYTPNKQSERPSMFSEGSSESTPILSAMNFQNNFIKIQDNS